MVGYRTTPGLPVAHTISPATVWKVSERFGSTTVAPDALETITNAQKAILATAHVMGYTIDGWVQSAARSLVAITTKGLFLKAPLFDRDNIAEAIRMYSKAGYGAVVKQVYRDTNLPGYPVIVMERVEGIALSDTLAGTPQLREIVHIVQNVQPDEDQFSQYMTLEDRIAMEIREARQRYHTIHQYIPTDAPYHEWMETLLNMGESLVASDAPRVLCHGDLDFRNIVVAGDDYHNFMLLDPEPVVAPIEFDVGKIMDNELEFDPVYLRTVDVDLCWRFQIFHETAWKLYRVVKQHFVDNFRP